MAQLRPFDFRYTGLLWRQLGAGSTDAPQGVAQIGGIHWSSAPPVLAGQTYESGLTLATVSLTVAANLKLSEVSRWNTGAVITFNNNQTAPASGIGCSVVWNGFIYGTSDAGVVKKRANSMAAWSSSLWTIGGRRNQLCVAMEGPKTRMVQSVYSADFQTASAIVVRTDSDRSAPVNLGTSTSDGETFFGNAIWRIYEVAVGTIIGLCTGPGPLFRTTNDGVSWTAINGPLSTPAIRQWCGIWKGTGNNLHMIGTAMAIATSTDQGVTWTVNSAVPGAQQISIFVNDASLSYSAPCLAFDLVNRKALVVTTNGALLSFNLDTPTTGYVIEQPNNWQTGMTQCVLMDTKEAYWLIGNIAAVKSGYWYCRKGQPVNGAWKQAFPLTRIHASNNSPLYLTCPVGLEIGDGRIAFDFEQLAPATLPMSINVADMRDQFDRYTITDPLLPSGRKPFVRVA